jgi:hypothetical protein
VGGLAPPPSYFPAEFSPSVFLPGRIHHLVLKGSRSSKSALFEE